MSALTVMRQVSTVVLQGEARSCMRADMDQARKDVHDMAWLGELLIREHEAMGGAFTPDWQLFREALARVKGPHDEMSF